LRRRIDQIDLKLLQLLNQRATLALGIGALKRKRKLPVLDVRREKAVLRRVAQTNHGPLTRSAIRAIFAEILRRNRKLQR
jgi:chorismate mutase